MPQIKYNRIIFLLILVASIRIFFFSSIFPVFNNVDEPNHYDLIVKYSKFIFPGKNDIYFSDESAENIILYGSPEYLNKRENFVSNQVPLPCWTYPEETRKKILNMTLPKLKSTINHEVFSPPVYYFIAGLWYNAGKLLGLKGGYLLYWLRFLNIPVLIFLIYFSFTFIKYFYPENRFLQISVPLILTFFPQDLFYSINNDTFSPLFCLISLFLILKLNKNNIKNTLFYILTGLFVSITFLLKYSNIPFVIIFLLILLVKFFKILNYNKKDELHKISLALIFFLIPVSIWFLRNYLVFGDFTGESLKAHSLGWTIKPLKEIFNHPIFSFSGFTYFFTETTKTFWRGEFVWFLERICERRIDIIYFISTITFVSISTVFFFINRNKNIDYLIYILVCFFSVLFLILLSLIYDFGKCWYPSKNLPFFTSGRLIIGILIPFLILYLDGFYTLTYRISKINPYPVLLLLILIITISEIIISKDVFSSKYNFFYLLKDCM